MKKNFKKKMGRDPQRYFIGLAVTKEQRDAIISLAEAESMSLSCYLRRILFLEKKLLEIFKDKNNASRSKS